MMKTTPLALLLLGASASTWGFTIPTPYHSPCCFRSTGGRGTSSTSSASPFRRGSTLFATPQLPSPFVLKNDEADTVDQKIKARFGPAAQIENILRANGSVLMENTKEELTAAVSNADSFNVYLWLQVNNDQDIGWDGILEANDDAETVELKLKAVFGGGAALNNRQVKGRSILSAPKKIVLPLFTGVDEESVWMWIQASKYPKEFPEEFVKKYVRSNWTSFWPERNGQCIGSTPNPFGNVPILQDDIIRDLASYIGKPNDISGRREYAALLAMSGFGKTVSLDMITETAWACRRYMAGKFDWSSASTQIEKRVSSKDMDDSNWETLGICLPVAITMNAKMMLQPDEENMDRAIASRLLYSYFSDPAVSLRIWQNSLGSEASDLIGAVQILDQVAQNAGYKYLLLMVDEPNIRGTGRQVADQMKRVLEPSLPHVRVVLTGLQANWIRATGDFESSDFTTTSGYPIKILPMEGIPTKFVHGKVSSQVQKSMGKENYRERALYFIALASGRWRTLRDYMNILESDDIGSMTEFFRNDYFTILEPAPPRYFLSSLAHSILSSELNWSEVLLPAGVIARTAANRHCIRTDIKLNSAMRPRIALDIIGYWVGKLGDPFKLTEEKRNSIFGKSWRSFLLSFFEKGKYDLMDVKGNLPDSFEKVTGSIVISKWWSYQYIRGPTKVTNNRELFLLPVDVEEASKQLWFKTELSIAEMGARAVSYVETVIRECEIKGHPLNTIDNDRRLCELLSDFSKWNFDEVGDPVVHAKKLVSDTADYTDSIGIKECGKDWKTENYKQFRNRYESLACPTAVELAKRVTFFRDAAFIGKSTTDSIIIKQPPFLDDNGDIIPRFLTLDLEGMFVCPPVGYDPRGPWRHSTMRDANTNDLYQANGCLPFGTVLLPGSSVNPATDSLLLLESSDEKPVLVFFENKRLKTLKLSDVQRKLDLFIRLYRGVLFVQDEDDDHPERAQELSLPKVLEENVVFVLLTAAECQVENLENVVVDEGFKGRAIHACSETFFGPTFSLLPAVQF